MNININLSPETRDRLRFLLQPLPLHIAGALLLAAVNIYLAIHLAIAAGIAHRNNADAIQQQSIQARAADLAARPLRGIDAKLATSENAQADFYARRLPTAYSTIAADLGQIAHSSGVKLTRVQYTQTPSLAGSPEFSLDEVRMDATLSGDYRPLTLFLNGLERSKTFFLVSGVTLTGQQTGTVNLRIRVLTYLRQASVGEPNDRTPPADTATPSKEAAR